MLRDSAYAAYGKGSWGCRLTDFAERAIRGQNKKRFAAALEGVLQKDFAELVSFHTFSVAGAFFVKLVTFSHFLSLFSKPRPAWGALTAKLRWTPWLKVTGAPAADLYIRLAFCCGLHVLSEYLNCKGRTFF